MSIAELKPIIEAAILASHQPLSIEQLADLFDETARPSHTELAQALEALSFECNERGVELVEVASGFRYQIKSSVYGHVSKLWTERQTRYSRALLETLALIAYRQPITRAEIEAVRGVSVSSHIVRTLEEREWVRVVGHREVPGRPALYGTTRGFLDYFKLKSLEELPTLSELKDLENLAPELDFEGGANAAVAQPPLVVDAGNTLDQELQAPARVETSADLTDLVNQADAKNDLPRDSKPSKVASNADADAQSTSDLSHLEQISDQQPEHDSGPSESENN